MKIHSIDKNIMAQFPWPDMNANKHSRGRLALFSGMNYTLAQFALRRMQAHELGQAGW